VRHAADHDGVDDIGRHPAEFAEGEGRAEAGGEFEFARQGFGIGGRSICIAPYGRGNQRGAPNRS
jgi:hypothetical protein